MPKWTEIRRSGTVRFLQGKVYPGTNSPVREITARGNIRLVHLQDGSMLRQTKRQLVGAFKKVMSGEQFVRMKQTIRSSPDGTVTARVGGVQKGEVRHYKSKGTALAALRKRYEQ